MALDPRKRQKKVERNRAKQKTRRNEMRPVDRFDFMDRMQRVEGVPFLHCAMTQAIFDRGLGTVLVSREFPNSTVAYASFLVDLYCLGVKDAFYGVFPRSVYETTFDYVRDGRPLFIPGPYDSPAHCEEILSALAAHSRAGQQEIGVRPVLRLTANS